MWKELIKKVELQSIIVLLITLGSGCYLFSIDNKYYPVTGYLGGGLIFLGMLYTVGSFYSNQLKENYNDAISALKGGYKESHDLMKDTVKFANESKKIGDYKMIDSPEETIQK